MKKKFLVFALIAALFMLVSVNSASAIWMTDATINWVGVTPAGNYTFNASVGSWTKTYTVLTSDANATAILAVLLTAVSSGATVTIDYTGSVINTVYL